MNFEKELDPYTRMQYNKLKKIHEKKVLMDPQKREAYFAYKEEQARLDKLVRDHERKMRF